MCRLLHQSLLTLLLILLATLTGATGDAIYADCGASCRSQSESSVRSLEAAAVQEATSTPETSATQTEPIPLVTTKTVDITEQRRVKVNFYINSISKVNEANGTYDIDFWLDLFWFDPMLKGKSVADVDPATLWQPAIEAVNSSNLQSRSLSFDDSFEPDTNVRLSQRLIGTFTNQFDLYTFPFDQQVITIKLESAEYESNRVLFEYLELGQTISYSEKPFIQSLLLARHLSPDIALNDWAVERGQLIHQIHVLPYDKSSWSQFRIDLVIKRSFGVYLWKIVAVVLFLMLLTWGALFVDLQELRYRLLSFLVLILASVTFDFTRLQITPRTPYLTLLDLYTLAGYLLIALATVGAIGAKFIHDRGHQLRASQINRWLLSAYPILILLFNLLFFWFILG